MHHSSNSFEQVLVIVEIFQTLVLHYDVCLLTLETQKSGQNFAVLPGWGEKTCLGGTVLRLLRSSADHVPRDIQESGYEAKSAQSIPVYPNEKLPLFRKNTTILFESFQVFISSLFQYFPIFFICFLNQDIVDRVPLLERKLIFQLIRMTSANLIQNTDRVFCAGDCVRIHL